MDGDPVPRIQYHWEHSLTPLGWSCMALTTLSIPGSASRVSRGLTETEFISMVITFRILTLEERYHHVGFWFFFHRGQIPIFLDTSFFFLACTEAWATIL
ncbi:hypothetical protein VNO77_23166 [Canavalia gladiata]|uniref:Uncharacterized protein n=1 Tax=Canavalia gladiata TaxID=3824 RepID=A0AAN9L5F4_CANGL